MADFKDDTISFERCLQRRQYRQCIRHDFSGRFNGRTPNPYSLLAHHETDVTGIKRSVIRLILIITDKFLKQAGRNDGALIHFYFYFFLASPFSYLANCIKLLIQYYQLSL